ncbi:Neprilysin-2 [Folsomia candida]|uniref:Neprilysin-2 n=1 Tax=Folsomia candida TaxID=158441 RepID=A0A226DPE9_FOLCA|nr:Neprilysin-2 [Folsomia candida]
MPRLILHRFDTPPAYFERSRPDYSIDIQNDKSDFTTFDIANTVMRSSHVEMLAIFEIPAPKMRLKRWQQRKHVLLLVVIGSVLHLILFLIFTCMSHNGVKSSSSTKFEPIVSESVQPCEDFYQYACGEWIKDRSAKLKVENKSKASILEDLAENNLVLLRNLIEALPNNYKNGVKGKIKKIFNSCMDRPKNQNSDALNSINPDRIISGRWQTEIWMNIQLFKTSLSPSVSIVELLSTLILSLHLAPVDSSILIDECISMTVMLIPEGVAHLYLKANYLNDPATHQSVTGVAEAVRKTLLTTISSLTWIDAESKLNITRRMEKLPIIIGSPEDIKNLTHIEQLYSRASISNNFRLNMLSS